MNAGSKDRGKTAKYPIRELSICLLRRGDTIETEGTLQSYQVFWLVLEWCICFHAVGRGRANGSTDRSKKGSTENVEQEIDSHKAGEAMVSMKLRLKKDGVVPVINMDTIYDPRSDEAIQSRVVPSVSIVKQLN